jgi:threonine/homoserine/homoserine lactone efflux protein
MVTGLTAFSLAVLALLVAPGPTNALLAASGARLGVMRSLPMLAVVLAAYAVSIGVVTLLLAPQLQASPALWLAARLAAALYLSWLGLRLWRSVERSGDGRDAPVRAAEMFVATLLNPKGLVIGLVLLPRGQEAGLAPYFLVLAFAILGCGLIWIVAGHAFAAAAPRLASRRLINRASGATMLAFAAFFLISAAYSMLAAHAP